LLSVCAFAGTAYDNGPINGQVDAFTINFGFVVTNSFTISGQNETINSLTFGAWLEPGDTLSSVDVQLSSSPFGGENFFQSVLNVTQSNCFANNFGFNVCAETTSNFSGPTLAPGNYWLTLQNAVVTNGDPVYWDENSGVGCQSPGCPSQAQQQGVGSIPSEAFTLLGSSSTTTDVVTVTGTTPEPGSLVLFGTGLLALAGFIRRRFF